MSSTVMDTKDSAAGILEWVGKLIDFRGREARLSYLVLVIEAAFIAASLSTAYVAWQMFTGDLLESRISGFLAEAQELFLTARLWGFAGFLLLIAAATARRLHDSGRSALPAIVPAAFSLAAMWAFGQLFSRDGDLKVEDAAEEAEPTIGSTIDSLVDDLRPPRIWDASTGDLAIFGLLTLLTFVAAIPLVIGLVRKGDTEANQFGEPVADD